MNKPGLKPGHDQSSHRVRMEWGPTGATAVAADVTVVIDVLSFTTTVSIAVERGITVLPFVWKDDRAREYAAARDAVLAVGRLEARSLAAGDARGVSLSPAAMTTVSGVERIVLPSPNGSTICFALAGTGATVVAASLRNASAVASCVASLLADGATCAVIPAGERWPDGTLRPAVEDLWGAGAVIAGLVDLGITGLSPEARVAEHAFRAVRPDLGDELAGCASGIELAAAGYVDDVEVAGQLDVSRVVPVLTGGAFSPYPNRIGRMTRTEATIDGGILVGHDGSSASTQAVAWAAKHAARLGVPIHVLRAWSLTNAPRPASMKPGYVPPPEDFEAAVLEQLTRDIEAMNLPTACDVRLHAVHGQSSAALLEAAAGAEIVVVGRRGAGGFRGLLSGSTADQVVRYAPCPVVVVPVDRD